MLQKTLEIFMVVKFIQFKFDVDSSSLHQDARIYIQKHDCEAVLSGCHSV